MNKVANLLKDPNNLMIINVTHDYLFKLKQKTNPNHEYFMPTEETSNLILNESNINDIFTRLSKIIDINKIKKSIIVFEEYFFSKGTPMSCEEFSKISKICENFTSKYENTILFVNLLHKINLTNDVKEQEKINNLINLYSNDISSRREDNKTFWNISSYKSGLIIDQTNIYVRNCTYVYMKGKLLYYHKKSSYNYELLELINYDIGFFEEDIINKNLLDEEADLAQLISETFQIHICYDFSFNFEKRLNFLEKEKNNFLLFNENTLKNINKLLELYKSSNITKKKKKILYHSK